MEYINKALGNNNDTAGQPEGTVNATEQTGNEGGGGFMGALSDKFNTMAGGGKASEANEGESHTLAYLERIANANPRLPRQGVSRHMQTSKRSTDVSNKVLICTKRKSSDKAPRTTNLLPNKPKTRL